jgi:hypothetical protein
MDEDFLDEADVGPVLVHQRRHCVTEEMAGSGLAQLGRVDPGLHVRGHVVTATQGCPSNREPPIFT